MTSGFTDERVREWVAAAPLRWPRWVLTALWVVAFVISMESDDEPCTTADLTVCGPDLAFSVSMTFCFAALVLVWWRPLVAAVCAVVFAAADIAFDYLWQAKVSWSLLAVAFVLYAAHLLSVTARQRAVAAEARVPVPPWPRGSHRALTLDGPHRLMAAGVVVLVLVASGSVYGYQRAAGLESEHLSRSQVIEAQVLSDEDEDGNQRVRLATRPEGFPSELDIYFLEVPAVGDAVSLRIDPRDPSWSHEVAEPPDPTWWATLGLGALLLAGLLAERLLAVRVRRRFLEQSHHAEGVPVRVFNDDLDFVGLVATDSARGLGEFPVDEVLRLDTPEGRRTAAPTDAFLVGDLRHGGWAALVRRDGMRLPLGPLVALPEDTEIDMDSFDRDPEDPRDWSEPVPMGTVPAHLPVVDESPVWLKAAGLVLSLAVVPVGMWLLWDDGVGIGGAGVVFGAGSALHWGLDQVVQRVWVDADGFEMASVFHAVESPMGAVREVRVDGDLALVIFDDESVLEVVAPDGDGRALAAAIEQAAESAPRVAEGAAPDSHRPWSLFAFGAGVLVLVATWLTHWLG